MEETKSWAEREVELACKSESEAADSVDDAAYGIACYKSALKAYNSIMEDSVDSMSVQLTKSILNRLLNGQCLTPVEDTPDIWIDVTENLHITGKEGYKHYQCTRMSGLFKEVAPDGTVTYSTTGRVQAIDIDNPTIAYQNSFCTALVNKLFPIQMPYFPAEKKYRVYRETFLANEENSKYDTYDTMAILYVMTPDGKKVKIDHYFKKDIEFDAQWVPITKEEYDERKARKIG